MPTVCEIKVALKAKGIKGISGLNKSGLQSLLNQPLKKVEPKSARGTPPAGDTLYNKAEKFLNKMDKVQPKSAHGTPPAPKPFTPAATKGESPKVAEKKITKKPRAPQQLRLTYKEEVKAETKTKPPPKLKKAKQTEDERLDMLSMKRELPGCRKFLKQAGIKNEEELKKYIITNHPDKLKNQDPNSKAAILYKELLNCSTVLRTMKNYVKEGYIRSFKSFFSN